MNMEYPVIIERKALLDDVCRGILKKKYYSILGPKGIGKTTFLKDIKNKIKQETGENFRCIYIDLGNLKTADTKLFYSELANRIAGELNISLTEKVHSKEGFHVFFISILKSNKQNILMLLDEIEHIPEYITKELLELFRTYHQARERETFYERLSVIISGSTNLLEFTMGGLNSPFNIADPILLSDLDHADGSGLIDKIMSRHSAKIEPSAKQKILEETNGHPYLISRLCALSVEKLGDKIVGDNIVNAAIERLTANNKVDKFFSFIIQKVENDLDIFETLVEILDKGSARQKQPVVTIGKHELSGAFSKENNVFKIRNNIIKKLFDGYFDNVRRGDIFVMLGRWDKGLEFYKREKHVDRMKRRRKDTITVTRKRRVDIINAIANMMFLAQKSTEEIYEYLLDGIHYSLSYESVYLYSVNKDENCLILKNYRGGTPNQEKKKIEEYSQVLEVRAYNAQKYMEEDKNEQNNYAVAFPLQLDGSVDWILSINNYGSRFNIKSYDCDELKTFTNEAIIAIKNAKTYYDLYREKQAILDAVGEEISIIDNEFNVLYMNRLKTERIGKDYSNTKKKCYKVFKHKYAPCTECPCMGAIYNGEITRSSNYHRECNKNKKKYFVVQTASPLKDADGTCSKAINIVRDVTKQIILFQIIDDLQKELDLNKLITIIMDGIVKLGYKRVRFYDFKKKGRVKSVIGRFSRGMEDCRIKFRGYRVDLKDARYIKPTLADKKPKFYFGNNRDTQLKNCKWLRDLQLENVKWMDLPLVSGKKLTGFIGIDNKSTGEEFTNEDLNTMAILASYAAQAIVKSNYISKQEKLYDISKKISGPLDIKKLQEEIVKAICEALKTEMCSIFLYDAHDKLLIRKSNYALTKDGWTHHIDFEETYELGAYICGKVYKKGMTIIINDIENYKKSKNSKYIKQHKSILKSKKVKNAIFAPVTYKDLKIGIIRAANKLDENSELFEIGFKQEDLDFLVSLGEQIAIALDNSRLYEEKSRQLGGIKALNQVISKITSAANLKEIYKTIEGIKEDVFPNIHEMCLLEKKETGDFLPIFECPKRDTLDCIRCKEKERECIKKGEKYDNYYCSDVGTDPFFEKARRKDLKSRFVIPMIFEKELLGILDIGSKTRDAFSPFEQNLLTSLGSQIAIAINNHIKHDKQIDIFKDISHTLGTYLTPMRGYTQLLVEEKVSDEAEKKEYLKDLLGDVLAINDSVNEISSLVNIDYWINSLISEKVEIMEIVKNLAVKNKFLLEEKQLKLTTSPLDASIYVKGDRQKLEEALQSLMNNAIKFTDKNKNIEILVATEGDHVLIRIKDEGYGINKDDKERIFKKYERGQYAKEQKIPGTGIGLALAKSIINRHSGDIDVESDVGKGSTFTIILPIYKEDVR